MLLRGSRWYTQMHKNKGGLLTHESESVLDFSILQPPEASRLTWSRKSSPRRRKTALPGFDCLWLLARGLSERRPSRLTHRRRAVTAARSLAGCSSWDPGPVKPQCGRDATPPRRHEPDLILWRLVMIKPTMALKQTYITHNREGKHGL